MQIPNRNSNRNRNRKAAPSASSQYAIEPLTEHTLDPAAHIFALTFADALRPLMPTASIDDLVRFRRGRLRKAIARAVGEVPPSASEEEGGAGGGEGEGEEEDSTRLPPSIYRNATAAEVRGGMRGKIRAVVVRHRPSDEVAGLYLFELYEHGRPPSTSASTSTPTQADRSAAASEQEEEALPPGADAWQFEMFFELMGQEKKRHMGDQSFAYLSIAAVHPSHRGQGAHDALVAYFLLTTIHEWANPPAYLEALPAAVKLWTRHRFEHVQSYDITAHADAVRAERGMEPRPRTRSRSSIRAEAEVGGREGGGNDDDASAQAQEESEEDEHYWVHVMRRPSAANLDVFEEYGGLRAALGVLIPRTSQDVVSSPVV